MEDNLRKVQTLGMSGQIASFCDSGDNQGKPCATNDDCLGTQSGNCVSKVPSGGFGIAIGQIENENYQNCYESELGNPEVPNIDCPTTYTLFADTSGALGIFDQDDFALAGGENYALPKGVFIRDFGWYCLWASPEKLGCPVKGPFGLDITFRPPKPIPYFYTYSQSGPPPLDARAISEQSIKILVQHENTGKCREIYINGVSGEVSSIANSNCMINWP